VLINSAQRGKVFCDLVTKTITNFSINLLSTNFGTNLKTNDHFDTAFSTSTRCCTAPSDMTTADSTTDSRGGNIRKSEDFILRSCMGLL
jgi:hypothetical protein